MDKQQAFNIAYLGLATQGFLRSGISTPGDFSCAYRGEEGRKCAVGHLIPDEDFDPRYNINCGVRTLRIMSRKMSRGLRGLRSAFLTELQTAHDEGYTPLQMKELLDDFASEHSLTIPELPA